MRKTVLAALFFLAAFPLLADEGGYYFKLALNQYLASDYKEALSNLQMGVREDSRDWKIRQLLGYCAYQMNDNQDALAQCQESLRLHGDNPRLENFVKWLSVPEPRAARKKDEGAYLEGREAAQMPDPPDLNPGGKSDVVLQGLTIPTPAPPPDARNDLFKNVLFQVGSGSEFFGQNFNSHGAVGLGGELAVGYSLDDHWSFWWTGAMYLFQQSYLYYYGNYWYRQSYQIPNMEMTLSARYSFGDGPFQPYVGAGAGFYAGDSFYDIQHLIQGSLGARLKLDEALSLFAEARGNFITFQQSTAIDYPVNAGVILDFWGDKGGQGEAVSSPPDGDFFIKTGLGLTFGTDNYPYAPSISVNTTSFAAGYDFPNHFSFFTSLERFPGDWAVLANLQYNLWLPIPCQPYLFIGAGLDFPDGPAISNVNNAGQVGLGLNFNLNRALDLFFEAKAYDANNLFKFVDPYQVGTNVFETGLKFNLSATRNPVPPTPLETLRAVPGKMFVELAGGIDLLGQNWQSAYSQGSGGKFSAGYEFNDGLALQLDVEDFDYSGSNYVGVIWDHELLLLPTVRYLFLQKGIRPYLSVGAGLDVEVSWADGPLPPAQVGNFDLALGAGLEVPFDPLDSLFVEGKYNFIFADGVVGRDVPLLAGIKLGLN